jgi:hypothetical protein
MSQKPRISRRSRFLDFKQCNSGGSRNDAVCLFSPDREDDIHLSDNILWALDEIVSLRPEATALGSPQTLGHSKIGSVHHVKEVPEVA